MKAPARTYRHAIVLAAICLLAPATAWADDGMSLLDAAAAGPAEFFTWLLLQPLLSFLRDFLGPLVETSFQWGTDFMTIPYVNNVIYWLQGLSVLGVVAVRVAEGWRTGILRKGADFDYSPGEYVFKSMWALLVVAIMPTACRLVIMFGKSMFDYVVGATGGVAGAMSWFDLSGLDPSLMSGSSALNLLWVLVAMLAVTILAIACGYQFVRRQVEMIVVSVIAPLIAVYSATEDDSGQVGDLLKQLFALVCQQWLQYVLVMVAVGFGQAWISGSAASWGSDPSSFSVWGGEAAVQTFMFCIATFMAALTMPRLVDRYTFGQSGTRVGGIVASQFIIHAMRRR
ncbi:MAG: hypothetical protein IJ111_13000 [Eggerthellaceae bacterium]|nr:hypothetical protein [Eggerthellaceae bacterium]